MSLSGSATRGSIFWTAPSPLRSSRPFGSSSAGGARSSWSRENLSAPIGPVRWLGIRPGGSWRNFGWIFAVIAGLAVAVPTILSASPAAGAFGRVMSLLPFVLLFAAVNAFNEEVYFRASFLATLVEVVGRGHALVMIAVFFGMAHYLYGSPPGIVGFLMTAFLGWLLGKSMLETRGFLWPWVIHFVPDVVVFVFYAMTWVQGKRNQSERTERFRRARRLSARRGRRRRARRARRVHVDGRDPPALRGRRDHGLRRVLERPGRLHRRYADDPLHGRGACPGGRKSPGRRPEGHLRRRRKRPSRLPQVAPDAGGGSELGAGAGDPGRPQGGGPAHCEKKRSGPAALPA